MTENEKIIDKCVTDIIEKATENILKSYNDDSVKQADEIEALASLIRARATIKSCDYSSESDLGTSKEWIVL